MGNRNASNNIFCNDDNTLRLLCSTQLPHVAINSRNVATETEDRIFHLFYLIKSNLNNHM